MQIFGHLPSQATSRNSLQEPGRQTHPPCALCGLKTFDQVIVLVVPADAQNKPYVIRLYGSVAEQVYESVSVY